MREPDRAVYRVLANPLSSICALKVRVITIERK